MSNVSTSSKLVVEWRATKTVARLFHYLDARDYDAVAALFTPEGVWMRMGQKLVGQAGIRAAMAGRPATLSTRHIVSNLIADADESGVDARYYLTVFDDPDSDSGPGLLNGPSAIFLCQDRLVEMDAGWRFASRHPELVFKRR